MRVCVCVSVCLLAVNTHFQRLDVHGKIENTSIDPH